MRFGVGFVGVVKGFVFFQWRQLDCNTIAGRFLQFITTKTREDYGDVVFTAAIVGFRDQFVTGFARSGLLETMF